MNNKIIFFGSSPFSNIVLEKLLRSKRYELSAIVTKPDRPVGRGQKMTSNPVKVLAEENGLNVQFTMNNLQVSPGTVGLVAAYGKIIPQNVLDTFGGQIYNIHPSLLPKYRGPSPLQQQILDDQSETGVTIIQLDSQMDHGPILAQETDSILPEDTWITLGERLFAKGTDLISNSQFSIFNETPIPQNHNDATYTKMITRQDGFITWKEFSSLLTTHNSSLKRKHRAYASWPGVWTLMPDGKRLKLISLEPQTVVQIEGKSPQPWPIVV